MATGRAKSPTGSSSARGRCGMCLVSLAQHQQRVKRIDGDKDGGGDLGGDLLSPEQSAGTKPPSIVVATIHEQLVKRASKNSDTAARSSSSWHKAIPAYTAKERRQHQRSPFRTVKLKRVYQHAAKGAGNRADQAAGKRSISPAGAKFCQPGELLCRWR